MVFIRPTILRSAADARALTQQRYGYIRDQQLIGSPDVEPSLDALVRDYMGTAPPIPPVAEPGDTTVAPPIPVPPDAVTPPVATPLETRSSSTVVRPVDVPPSRAQP